MTGVQTCALPISTTTIVANNDYFVVAENNKLAIDKPGVLANDSDIDSVPLTAVLVSGPANGTLTLNADGSFAYDPNPDFNGVDTFTYRVSDGTTTSGLATVTITVTPVNDAPLVGVGHGPRRVEDEHLTARGGVVGVAGGLVAPRVGLGVDEDLAAGGQGQPAASRDPELARALVAPRRDRAVGAQRQREAVAGGHPRRHRRRCCFGALLCRAGSKPASTPHP